ncbi:hypothetical protein PGT21_033517 [Puccinia graminis f. sp. tritici]|uniref:Uncharacterized protein n=2 Tax=Puccinia graminis f. sp. tritici TaxID=56615 RepID=H6QVF9_PUCGT|nr:uncharacterized protein PGTG_22740 [Puccinia graminis f. sp. tritici CRL 75-36-700-3]EHS62942.1 hypothetical protein PGTG_22740 [Puccinia graminis f. sp. tritici CRL 75-36-700-3]KAA1075311.1 hypothetical protein PGT21_033517 [Puccinia graminis f. sp. tritici]
MSTTSQSDNESRSPTHPAQHGPTNRSNPTSLANHRTRPYPTSLPRNGGGVACPAGVTILDPAPCRVPLGSKLSQPVTDQQWEPFAILDGQERV